MSTATLSGRIGHALGRRARILTSPHLPLADRLRVVLSRGASSALAVRRQVRREGEDLVIAIDGFTFAVPIPPGPTGEVDRLDAFSQVVAETFVDPLLFQGPVQIKAGDTVFDVGAHIGTTAALFSRRVGPSGKVFAFEPGVDADLRRHVEANHLANVEVVAAAVGSAPGSADLSMGATGIDSTIGRELDWHSNRKTVPIITLDDFREERGIERVDFTKMDIEGFEEPALEGALRLIAACRPKWSISSYHTDLSGEAQHPKLVAFLKASGYNVDEIPGFHIFAH